MMHACSFGGSASTTKCNLSAVLSRAGPSHTSKDDALCRVVPCCAALLCSVLSQAKPGVKLHMLGESVDGHDVDVLQVGVERAVCIRSPLCCQPTGCVLKGCSGSIAGLVAHAGSIQLLRALCHQPDHLLRHHVQQTTPAQRLTCVCAWPCAVWRCRWCR